MSAMHELLHGIAIKKHVDLISLGYLTGVELDVAKDLLNHATTTGRIAATQGKYMLTPVGRMILEEQYGRYCVGARKDVEFLNAYDHFEVINTNLKQIITDWQTIVVGGQSVPNDHADLDYDEKIMHRLAGVHERLENLLGVFAVHSRRFDYYSRQLTAALEKAEDGAREWVSEPKIDSYHTIWFEMHEDLLRMLGRERDA